MRCQSPGWLPRGLVLAASATLAAASAWAQPPERPLAEMPLEELLSIQVTLPTRSERPLFETAAAVYVVDAEQIRRSGAASLAEALRLVPGLHVARAGSSRWAISARGFTSEFSDKLLVLVDGRSVYAPLFAGVYWDAQDVLLEDVERIEVIRGPGASLWGANAVNGVVSVVTRRSSDASGTALSFRTGGAERAIASLRHGTSLGGGAHLRAWGRFADRPDFEDAAGAPVGDRWAVLRGGARLDWSIGESELSVEGEAYRGDIGSTVVEARPWPPYSEVLTREHRVSGAYARARWENRGAAGASTSAQVYVDRTEREASGERRDTLDMELTRGLRLGARHRVLAGVGYRVTQDEIASRAVTSFVPRSRALRLFSGFVQDEIALAGGWRVLAGTKAEHNDFTGLEVQPTLRLAWSDGERHALWSAVSRAVRTPSRGSQDVRHVARIFRGEDGRLRYLVVTGSQGLRSETVLAYEVGYRYRHGDTFSLDATAFANDYRRLTTLEPGEPRPLPDDPRAVLLPRVAANGAEAFALGLEAVACWRPARAWSLTLSYAHLEVNVEAPASLDPEATASEGYAPLRQLDLHSRLDLPAGTELDVSLYLVDGLPTRGVAPYARLDAMLGWRPSERLELRAGIQNALRSNHLEASRPISGALDTAVARSLFVRASWGF